MGLEKACIRESCVGLFRLITFCSSTVTIGIFLILAECEAIDLPPTDIDLLDQRCLNCVCQAMTGCSYSSECITEEQVFCGPYKMTYPFWLDAGTPGKRTDDTMADDFIICAQSVQCSKTAMEKYNRQFYKDCNGNDIIDCVDFFRTHLAGPNLCKNNKLEASQYWLKFLECYLNTAESVEAALNSIRGAKFD